MATSLIKALPKDKQKYRVQKTFIDGGSDLNLINEDTTKAISLKMKVDKSQIIKDAQGDNKRTTYKNTIKLWIEGVRHTIEVFVVPNKVMYSILLGRKQIRTAGIIGIYKYSIYLIKDEQGNPVRIIPTKMSLYSPLAPEEKVTMPTTRSRILVEEEARNTDKIEQDVTDKILQLIIE